MRKLSFGTPPSDGVEAKLDWIIDALNKIQEASYDEPIEFFDEFVPTNVTTSREFDADTATVAQLSDVVGTLINDMKGREV
ncbi:MAG: hypothetical protein GY938_05040 [Ketobacter sp.]|nr:hypothetical protein [Ketobacter sp.]